MAMVSRIVALFAMLLVSAGSYCFATCNVSPCHGAEAPAPCHSTPQEKQVDSCAHPELSLAKDVIVEEPEVTICLWRTPAPPLTPSASLDQLRDALEQPLAPSFHTVLRI